MRSPCGHSYCLSCIGDHWDQEDQKRVYSCPQCRHFTPRTVLGENTMLAEVVETHKRSAQAAVEDTERIFTELIRSIVRSRSELTQLIRDQEKTLMTQAKGLSERMEQEIEDLRRRDAELEQLSHTDHHIHFLQSFQSLSVPPGSTDPPTIRSFLSFDDLRTFVSPLKEKLQHVLKEETENIFAKVKYIKMIPSPECNSRDEFLQYYKRFTLDADTAHETLRLSEENRVLRNMNKSQLYPDHPDRFDRLAQVLCTESVWGRCYWEVEWSGDVDVSVSYKSISRKGQGGECVFGRNDQSWSLSCSGSRCSFWHNGRKTDLPVLSSSRIGVYVDHGEGTVSFYSVSNTMSLIHRVHTTFTQPLYPGFWVSLDARVKLCDPT